MPYLFLVLSSVIRGSIGIFVKYLAATPSEIAFLRLFIPAIISGMYMLVAGIRISKGDMWSMIAMSVIHAGRMYLYFVGFLLTTVGNAVATNYTGPIFTIIFASLFLGEKFNKMKMISVFLSFAGVLFIAFNKGFAISHNDLYGILAILAAAILSGIQTTISKSVIDRYDPMTMIFCQSLIGAIVYGTWFFTHPIVLSSHQIAVGSVFGFLVGIVGTGLYFLGLKKVEVGISRIMGYLEVVSGMIFAYIFLREIPGRGGIIGALLIILGGILIAYTSYRKKQLPVPVTE